MKKKLLVLFSILYCSLVIAQKYNSNEKGNFFVSNYERSFLNTIAGNWAVFQDKDGVIYIGNTANGILTYDGQKVRNVLNENNIIAKGLARAIISDSKNYIYAIIGDEFGYLEKNKLGEDIFYSLSKSLPNENKVTSTLWSAGVLNDTVIFQSEKAIYVYKYKKLIKIQNFDAVLHTVNINKNGAFLRIWDKGLYKFIGGEFKLIPSTVADFAKNRIDEQYALSNGDNLLVSRNTGLWNLTNEGVLSKLKTPIIDEFVKKYESYQGGEKLSNNIIPISTSKNGLIFIDENLQIKSVINFNNGLTATGVTSFIQDRVGDVWGSGRNIFRISFDSTITYFSPLNNLKGSVSSISRINGNIYVRTGSDLFQLITPKTIFDNVEFESKNVNELTGSSRDVIQFKDQIITTNNYTIKSTQNNITKIICPTYRSRVTVISKLNPNLIFTSNYVAGLLLHEYVNGNWKEIKILSNENPQCFDLYEITPGQLVLTTRKGIYKYVYNKNGQGVFYKLDMDKSFIKNEEYDLKIFNDTTVAIIDSLKNIYSVNLKNNKLTYSGINLQGIVGDDAWRYTYNKESKNGWLLTNKGLFKAEFNIQKGFQLKQYPFYKVSLSEISNGFFAEGVGDNEVLWIGSQDEKVYRYFPELTIKEKHQNFTALIRAVYSNGQKIPLEVGKIPFSLNNLTFEVAYPVYGNESKTTFSYWLEGQDSSWTSFTSDFKKEYTNLHEGNYKLHVRAKDASGEISKEAFLEFRISPPWYRSIWAYLIYLLTLIYSFILFGKYQAKKSFQKAENERKNSELAAAKDLQERLLPKSLPEIPNLDIAGYLRTSTEVGGDYYDFFEQADGSLYVICGDATGHGTPSGMLVSITKAGIIGLPQLSPKDMLHELNRVVKKVDLGILRMSLNIAFIKGNQLTLSSAGMPPYFLYRASSKSTEEIQLSGIPLGSFKDVEYDQTTIGFNTGDILVIISDGLPEAPNLEGQLFDYSKLQNLINSYGDETAQGVIDKLMIEADTWLSGKHNPDDITLVVIKHK